METFLTIKMLNTTGLLHHSHVSCAPFYMLKKAAAYSRGKKGLVMLLHPIVNFCQNIYEICQSKIYKFSYGRNLRMFLIS
jgi:hypothetical protein